MAVTYDAVTAGNVASDTNLSFSHTIGSGSNRLLVIFAFTGTGGSQTTDTVTYNSQSATEHGTFDAGQCAIWYVKEADLPSSGSYTVSIDVSGSTGISAIAFSVSDVDQTTPLDTESTAYSSTGIASVSSATDDRLVGFMGDGDGQSGVSITPDESEVIDQIDNGFHIFCQHAAGAASVDMTYTFSGGPNSPRNMVVNINAAAAAAGPVPQRLMIASYG